MLFPSILETERLRFQRLCRESVDLFELYDICSSDEGLDQITRFMPWNPHQTVQETQEFINWCESGWREGEQASYLLRPAGGEDGAGEIAGITRLECDWERRSAMLEVWLRKRFWGRGYSGERATALIELAFDQLDLELVSVNHEVGNDNSRRAIEQYIKSHGGQYDGLLRNWGFRPKEDKVVDAHRYTISKEQYERSISAI